MSEALIKAQIKTITESVSGIGVVHNRERYPRSIADFLNMMTSGGIVNGWTIHRTATPSAPVTMGGASSQHERAHNFKISGIYELNDELDSESAFQAILDAIYNAFKANRNLNGTCWQHGQFQINLVDVSDMSDYGGDIYHIAEGTLTVYERVT